MKRSIVWRLRAFHLTSSAEAANAVRRDAANEIERLHECLDEMVLRLQELSRLAGIYKKIGPDGEWSQE